jgi:hypothetical protein
LNESISKKNQKELEEIEKVAEAVEKITVKDENGQIRSFKKIIHFSDLKVRLEAYYRGSAFILKKADSNDIVGSQDELYFAYKELASGTSILCLDLYLSKKRKLEDEEGDGSESDISSDPQLTHHVGTWADGEIERFKIGVNTHGWGNWKAVAKTVGTRTAKQVSKFSENNQAKRLRQTDSITGAWVNLATSMALVSKGLEEK